MTRPAYREPPPASAQPTGTATILFGVVSLVGGILLMWLLGEGGARSEPGGIRLLELLVLAGIIGTIVSARVRRIPVAIACAVQGVSLIGVAIAGEFDTDLALALGLGILPGAIAVVALGAHARWPSRVRWPARDRQAAGPVPADGRPFSPIVGYTPGGTAITAPNTGTNAKAIIAFILAFTFAILAIPFGHLARSEIRRTGEGGGGLALAAIIIGYLNVAVLVAVGVLLASNL